MEQKQVNIFDLLGAYYERLMFTIHSGWWTIPAIMVNECEITDKALALCHLMTSNMHVVKETALLEKDMGIQATYLYSNIFPLPNGREDIAFIGSLGHEVGICAELLAPFMIEYKHPHETLRDLLEPFKDLSISPKGIHCPESPYAKALLMDNYDYFSNYGEEKTFKVDFDGDRKVMRVGIHPIEEYGFTYAISKMNVVNEYDNFFEHIQPEHTGRSIIYLNTEVWEVGK